MEGELGVNRVNWGGKLGEFGGRTGRVGEDKVSWRETGWGRGGTERIWGQNRVSLDPKLTTGQVWGQNMVSLEAEQGKLGRTR